MKITIIKVTKEYFYQEASSVEEAFDQVDVYGKEPDHKKEYANAIVGRHLSVSSKPVIMYPVGDETRDVI